MIEHAGVPRSQAEVLQMARERQFQDIRPTKAAEVYRNVSRPAPPEWALTDGTRAIEEIGFRSMTVLQEVIEKAHSDLKAQNDLIIEGSSQGLSAEVTARAAVAQQIISAYSWMPHSQDAPAVLAHITQIVTTGLVRSTLGSKSMELPKAWAEYAQVVTGIQEAPRGLPFGGVQALMLSKILERCPGDVDSSPEGRVALTDFGRFTGTVVTVGRHVVSQPQEFRDGRSSLEVKGVGGTVRNPYDQIGHSIDLATHREMLG